jgi:formamidopyrimidine-DNA glycosylase
VSVRDVYDFFRYDLPRGLRNLWDWFPLVWRDRDYDQHYLLEVLEFKFRRMAKVQQKGLHVGGEREAKHLMVCAELCKRLKEDNYHENMSGALEYKTWATPVEGSRHRQLHIETYKNGKLVDDEQGRTWWLAAERNRKNDQAYLGKIIGKRMMYWWD